jgi:hypothetical protein
MYLIIQYYNDKNIERQNEYNICLRKNLNNNAIKEIHNIIEKDVIIPDEFINNKKLININFDYSKIVPIEGRITFDYVFNYAKINIPNGEIIVISNLDIFLDSSNDWLNIKTNFFYINNDRKVLCLSRHEYNDININNVKLTEAQKIGSSSDTWVYKNDINETINNCNFSVGNCPQCDGAIHRIFYDNGFKVFNWAEKYKTFHVDKCRFGKNKVDVMIYNNKTDKTAQTLAGLECPPLQDWDKILNNIISAIYVLVKAPSQAQFLENPKLFNKPSNHFNWKIYINKNPDLLKAGINTSIKALNHWNKYGKIENRLCN